MQRREMGTLHYHHEHILGCVAELLQEPHFENGIVLAIPGLSPHGFMGGRPMIGQRVTDRVWHVLDMLVDLAVDPIDLLDRR